MRTATKSLLALTADDLMTRNVIPLTEEMPLRDAARLMLQNHIGGAPVVDRDGRCIGVLSATDFLRKAGSRADVTEPAASPQPVTCRFQMLLRVCNGHETTLCTFPFGVCPIQRSLKDTDGGARIVCSQPHSVPVDWQVVELEKLPVDEVRRYMTSDPVTVAASTSIRALARMMIDAHIHRVIVVDEDRRPIGIVSGTDLLAAVAYAEDEL
jgi:CBS domain-containing protein